MGIVGIVVQKYGGSSVADVERIQRVADRVAATRGSGRDVVVVVSAMGDTTDELLGLARRVTDNPARRELDMLLSAGERISMALLSMALNARDVPSGDILPLGRALAQPQVEHRRVLHEVRVEEVGPVRLFGLTAQLSRTPGAITSPPPRLGAHTGEILGGLGFSGPEIDALRDKGVV